MLSSGFGAVPSILAETCVFPNGIASNLSTSSGCLRDLHLKNFLGFHRRCTRVRTLSALNQPEHNQPEHNPSRDSTHHQRQEYHHIASKWNVRRTPLHQYPEDTRDFISRRRFKEPKHATTHTLEAIVGKDLEILLKALRFEAQHGYVNVQGRTGELFSDFAITKLRHTARELVGSGRDDLEQRCILLANRLEMVYSEESTNDEDARSIVVNTVISAVSSVLDQLRHKEKPVLSSESPVDRSRWNRYQRAMHSPERASAAFERNDMSETDPSSATRPLLRTIESRRDRGAPDEDSTLAHEEETTQTGNGILTASQEDGAADSALLERSRPTLRTDEGKARSDGGIGADSTEVDEKGDEYVRIGGRRIKKQTYEFRQSFREAAQRQASSIEHRPQDGTSTFDGQQRTDIWMKLRERRLTASAFSKALGFFPGDRNTLWEEKIGLRAPFAGNAATAWGVRSESIALQRYCQLTGQHVEPCMFKTKHEDPPHAWLGASPDGLLPALGVRGDPVDGSSMDERVSKDGEDQLEIAMMQGWHHSRKDIYGKQTMVKDSMHLDDGRCAVPSGAGPGILEIKCPFNRGRPEDAVPPKHAIWYYMPQLQGLMDIFDREWCHLFVWTPCHGSVIFLIDRDRRYWAACFDVLADFWWEKVVPARQEKEKGSAPGEPNLEKYRPEDIQSSSVALREWSKRLAVKAPSFRCH